MTIAIPLIALVVLLVVWAKRCPEIKEPTRHYVCRKIVPLDTFSWHARGIAVDIPFDPQRWEDVVDTIGRLRGAFAAMTPAAEQAARAMRFLHIELPPPEDQ